jgi:hypothetical protein
MERSDIRGGCVAYENPDCAALHPGYACFYRVVNDTPEIVRVLDGRQDIEENFAARDGE